MRNSSGRRTFRSTIAGAPEGKSQMASKSSRVMCIDRAVKGVLLAAVFLCGASVAKISAQSNGTRVVNPARTGTGTANRQGRVPRREAAYYSLFWGVDSFSVKAVESG